MTVAGWVLIIVIRGTSPLVGVVVDGFETEDACWKEAIQYGCDKGLGSKYICKCEVGSVVK